MTWLGAALAFAVTMIVFSTIVSAVTEIVHRVFQMRERGLRTMLEQMYDRFLLPALPQGAGVRKEDDEQARSKARTAFLDHLTTNLAVADWGRLGLLGRALAPRRRDALNTAEFLRRLAETDEGQSIRRLGAAQLDRLVSEAAVRFERVGADASLYFQQRARMIAVAVSLLVAFTLNVDAIRLYSALVADRDLTSRLLAQAEALSAAQDPPPGGAADESARTLDDATQRLRLAVDSTTALGLPIGWGFYPYCNAVAGNAPGSESPDPACRAASADGSGSGAVRRASGWLLSTILAGVLIGLGGPFWFDAIRRLSLPLTVVRTAGQVRPDEPTARVTADAPLADTPTGQPTLATDIFKSTLAMAAPKGGAAEAQGQGPEGS